MAKVKKKAAKKRSSSRKAARKAPAKAEEYGFNAKPAIEITATFKDTVGLTAKVAAAVAAEKVNILAGTGYSASAMYRKAIFTLIVDDYEKAERALEGIGAVDVEESTVILVNMANKVGALEKATSAVAKAGINIFYFYATTSTGRTATCVLKTHNDKKTIKLLNKIK